MAKVQFNLLPNSKYESMKTEAKEALMVRKTVLAALVCAALFVVLLGYTEGVQRVQISATTKSIATGKAKLEKVPNINAILTIQNQLQAAAALHREQHDTSRIFDYMSKLTPPNASVGNLALDMGSKVMKIDGSADSAATVNAFIDTLKYTQYKVGKASAKTAFSSVIESNFAIGQSGVTFSITANFDPNLFANDLTDSDGKPLMPQLVVPNSTNTRAGNDPGSLFGGNR